MEHLGALSTECKCSTQSSYKIRRRQLTMTIRGGVVIHEGTSDLEPFSVDFSTRGRVSTKVDPYRYSEERILYLRVDGPVQCT